MSTEVDRIDNLVLKNEEQQRIINALDTRARNKTIDTNAKIEQINTLEKEVTDRKNQVTEAQAETRMIKEQWENDIQTIGRLAAEYANDEGHCQAWDDLVDSINNELKGHKIPPRPRTYEVSVTFCFDVHATDEDDARVAAEENFDNAGRTWTDSSNYEIELE